MANIIILYAEIMPYNVVCFKSLLTICDANIHIVSWGKNKKLTPYTPPLLPNITYHLKENFNAGHIIGMIDKLKPACLYVSGRMEKDYLKACLYARKKNISVIGTSDNQYLGNLKQYITKVFSNLLYKRYFNYMMVPGLYQYEYMRFLGYDRDRILFPQYCADTTLFNNYFNKRKEYKAEKKDILFVGRLNKVKGIHYLIEAFTQIVKERGVMSNLLIVGNGPEKLNIPAHKNILSFDFLTQEQIIDLLPTVKFFCLPSVNEPWGVVIHEMAAAGIPIVTTKNVGAATAFVKNYYNGLLINKNDVDSLKMAMIYMLNLSTLELEYMEERSFELSTQIKPDLWATTIKSILETIN